MRFSDSLYHTKGYLKTLLQEVKAQPDYLFRLFTSCWALFTSSSSLPMRSR